MKFTIKTMALLLALVGLPFAKSTDLYFFEPSNGVSPCLAKQFMRCASDTAATSLKSFFNSYIHKVRIRIIDAPESDAGEFGIYLERPFLIIDGIHLSTDEQRTLDQFEQDTREFGIPAMLKSLGYTPVLVQFSQTVRRSLTSNAESLVNLMHYLNSNSQLPFPNRAEDGFIALGISQGGIIGRYAAYRYDITRSKTEAPIRLYASLDSPHQGAVMPRGLISTIDFWATEGGVASAEAFNDLIKGPGARDLLLYQTDTERHDSSTAESRFLFGEYRKAANYKGFPAVLVAQGQLKGKDPSHANTYYDLNRFASLAGKVLGRASSHFGYSLTPLTTFAYNRKYRTASEDESKTAYGISRLDFVQGSTYPFPQTMYESLREGMMEAIPGTMYYRVGFDSFGIDVELNTEWETDKLNQAVSTFIPTASALDLKCNGELSMRSDCAHTITDKDMKFENPEGRSTAKAAYGIDPTHPRYGEAISGRHIESPIKDGTIDPQVLAGMQTDIWRVLCEVAKQDYDYDAKTFRNPMLNGFFAPSASCMDQTAMPDIIKNGGVLQTQDLAYARYDYNKGASESENTVEFQLPAGWQKVATFQSATVPPSGSSFEIKIKVDSPKSNWMKAELLLTYVKNGGGQVQLTEQNVTQDGSEHTLRWQLPANTEALEKHRWFRLILNSNGAKVTLSEPRIITNTRALEPAPSAVTSDKIYPNSEYAITPWSNTVQIAESQFNGKNVLDIAFGNRYDGVHISLGEIRSMDKFKSLFVEFVPGTCENTTVYFDTKPVGSANLGNNRLQNDFVSKILPLSEIVNTLVTPNGSLSASRLTLQSLHSNEKCSIKSISLL